MKLTDDDKEQLRKVIERSDDKIKGTSVFLSIFDEGYKKEPVPLLQLAIAIIHDKPIGLIVTKNTVVPEHLKKIAFAIEYADTTEECTAAAMKIVKLGKKLYGSEIKLKAQPYI